MTFIYISIIIYLLIGFFRAMGHLKYASGTTGPLITIISIMLFWPFIRTYSEKSFEDIDMDKFIIKDKNLRAKDLESLLARPIDDFKLCEERGITSLKAVQINFIGDLVQKRESDLLRVPNLGKRHLTEIKYWLASNNLTLAKDS